MADPAVVNAHGTSDLNPETSFYYGELSSKADAPLTHDPHSSLTTQTQNLKAFLNEAFLI
jgi:hypothetical protein